MKYKTTMTCMLIVALSTWNFGAIAGEQLEATVLGNNAALKYWQAFAMLPTLDRDDRKLLSSSSESPVNERARHIVEKAESSLKLMSKGASIDPCDWGTDMTDGIHILLPHCSKARELARLAALRARAQFADGNAQGAVDGLVATLRLAHHIGNHGTTVIETLVDYAVRHIAIETAASNLSEMTPGQRTYLAGVLKELQPPTESGESVRRERAGNLPYIKRVLREDGLLGLIKDLGDQAPKFSGSRQQNVRQLANLLKDPQNQALVMDRLDAHYDDMFEDAVRPYAEAISGLRRHSNAHISKTREKLDELIESKQLSEDAKANMALVADALFVQFMPALDSIKIGQARVTIHHAMLRAAIAYANEGMDAAAEVADPITGKPFRIGPIEGKPDWIELTSTIANRGKPVALRARVR